MDKNMFSMMITASLCLISMLINWPGAAFFFGLLFWFSWLDS